MSDIPSAQELDAMFTMANGNGRLCEARAEAERPAYDRRDATHLATFLFPAGHTCPVSTAKALCLEHAQYIAWASRHAGIICATCGVGVRKITIHPLGGRT